MTSALSWATLRRSMTYRGCCAVCCTTYVTPELRESVFATLADVLPERREFFLALQTQQAAEVRRG